MNSLLLSPSDLDLSALDRADLADGTRNHYKAAIVLMLALKVNPFDREQLIAHAGTLPHSGKANLRSALSIMLEDYVDQAKTSNAPIETIQRFLWHVDVIKKTLHTKTPSRKRTPHWLSQEQVDTITASALSHSLRDYIVLAVLLGAGLRREELETLTFDALSQIPYKGRMKDILTVKGKGDKVRMIPISPTLAAHLREWQAATGGGRVARRMIKGGKVGESLTAPRIFAMVRKYGTLIGIANLDPHDLRRSYGRIMYYANNKDIMLVKELLGHSSVKTTQEYIGLKSVLDVDVFPVGGLEVAGD